MGSNSLLAFSKMKMQFLSRERLLSIFGRKPSNVYALVDVRSRWEAAISQPSSPHILHNTDYTNSGLAERVACSAYCP